MHGGTHNRPHGKLLHDKGGTHRPLCTYLTEALEVIKLTDCENLKSDDETINYQTEATKLQTTMKTDIGSTDQRTLSHR